VITRRAEAAEARRADILRTAAELFFSQGYERTTVRDIARRLGIQTGTIFYHFASKQALLEAVMEEGLNRALERIRTAPASADPGTRLEALWRAHQNALLDPDTRYALKVLLFEARSLEPQAAALVRRRLAEYEAVFKEALSKAFDAGLLEDNPSAVRAFVFGALNWTLNWYEPGRGWDESDLVEDFVRLALRICGAAPARPTRPS